MHFSAVGALDRVAARAAISAAAERFTALLRQTDIEQPSVGTDWTVGAKENTGRRILLPGFRYPMKGSDYRNGKEERTWEVTEVHFYDRFPDSMFVKP